MSETRRVSCPPSARTTSPACAHITGTAPEWTKPRSLATSAASAATGEAAYSRPGRRAPPQHRDGVGDAVGHAVRPVGDDPVEVVGRLAADADAHARRGPRLAALRAADERAPAFALRADELHE